MNVRDMTSFEFAALLCPHFNATIERMEVVEVLDEDGVSWTVRLSIRPHDRRARLREATEHGETRELAMLTMVDKAPLWAQVHGLAPS